jgi:flagellar hook assembly protein FlgD
VLAVATPLQGDLLVDLETSSPVITPNGDSVNDALVLSYKLRQLTLERPVILRIYDLAGRMVRELEPLASRSGVFEQRWDGHDGSGNLVPPGTYVYDVTLNAENEERRTGVVSVVY